MAKNSALAVTPPVTPGGWARGWGELKKEENEGEAGLWRPCVLGACGGNGPGGAHFRDGLALYSTLLAHHW